MRVVYYAHKCCVSFGRTIVHLEIFLVANMFDFLYSLSGRWKPLDGL